MIEVESITTKFGTASLNSNGYWQITSGKEKNHLKYLHRLFYEDAHKCTLLPNAVIHHKDENRQNNRLDNLELMSNSDHMRLHSTGRTHSEETKEKLRQLGTGRKQSEETKLKMSQALKGRKFSEEHKRNLSKSKMGHKVSEETKRKQSNLWLDFYNSEEGEKAKQAHSKKLVEFYKTNDGKRIREKNSERFTGRGNPRCRWSEIDNAGGVGLLKWYKYTLGLKQKEVSRLHCWNRVLIFNYLKDIGLSWRTL